jgi:thioredoxin-like negative regulator of GroEL
VSSSSTSTPRNLSIYSSWCGPCIRIAPYVHKKSHETGIALAKVDVDAASDVAAKFSVTSMPTFAVIKGNINNLLMTKVGAKDETVNELFDCALKNK